MRMPTRAALIISSVPGQLGNELKGLLPAGRSPGKRQ